MYHDKVMDSKGVNSTYLYMVLSLHGLWTLTMMNTCWNWERTDLGVKGGAPSSWNTMVTISLPMWRLRSNWKQNRRTSH